MFRVCVIRRAVWGAGGARGFDSPLPPAPLKARRLWGCLGDAAGLTAGLGGCRRLHLGGQRGLRTLLAEQAPHGRRCGVPSPIAASDITGSPHYIARLRGQAPTSRRTFPTGTLGVFAHLSVCTSTSPQAHHGCSLRRPPGAAGLARWRVDRARHPPACLPSLLAPPATAVAHRPATPHLAGLRGCHGLCPARTPPPVTPGVHRRSTA
jgi:hypothetical protein